MDSFQCAIGPILIVSQFFGVMPVIGVTDKSAHRMKFRYCCVRSIYSIAIIVIALLETLLCVYRTIAEGLTFGSVGSFTFFFIATSSLILFYELARKWPKLMRHWQRTETVFLNVPYNSKQGRLKTKLRVVFAVFLFLTLGKEIHEQLIAKTNE